MTDTFDEDLFPEEPAAEGDAESLIRRAVDHVTAARTMPSTFAASL